MNNILHMRNMMFKLPLYSFNNVRKISTCVYPLQFRATNILLGEPLKKKKRIDQQIVRARNERRRKKIEKRIRFLEKVAGQLKIVEELDGLEELAQLGEERTRRVQELSEEETWRRTMLEAEWCNYRKKEWCKDMKSIWSIMQSQERALKELKAVSNDLYQKAIEIDERYLPYNANGPLHTPPISNYDSPDGQYTETTKKYPGET